MDDPLLALAIGSLGDALIKILKLQLKIEAAKEIEGPTSDLERWLDIHREMLGENLKLMEKRISDFRNVGTENALKTADSAEEAIKEQFEFAASQRDAVRSEIRKTHWHALAERAERAERADPAKSLKILMGNQEVYIKK